MSATRVILASEPPTRPLRPLQGHVPHVFGLARFDSRVCEDTAVLSVARSENRILASRYQAADVKAAAFVCADSERGVAVVFAWNALARQRDAGNGIAAIIHQPPADAAGGLQPDG